ncbi:nuclear transport factor 2 family protein [Caulobacter hibisci]|uniref:Nuclear transport factor 2 family protein n=2 Tax=Caulobacter hibisci TaxID=2035993 RepID=A0ABS0SZ03_9CAUL|nr:nuclear transport factor 2 family protein [Caulobacter hibisci]
MPSLLAALAATLVLIPTKPALTKAIQGRDEVMFDVMSEQCDAATLATIVADDMEFYHGKGGAMGRDAFNADYAKSCALKPAPDAWRPRRQLAPGTLKVYAIPGFGAVEEGTHLFYERKGDGPERLAGKARFSILWKLGPDGRWLMSRTFSIDHAPAQ